VEVGHVERNMYRAGGASCTLLQPLLDNQVGLKNMENCPKVSIPLEKVTLIFFIYTLPVPYFA
jgi:20S proteasome subunit beta 6